MCFEDIILVRVLWYNRISLFFSLIHRNISMTEKNFCLELSFYEIIVKTDLIYMYNYLNCEIICQHVKINHAILNNMRFDSSKFNQITLANQWF